MLVLLPRMVCNALVAGGRRSGAGQQAMRPGWGKLFEQLVLIKIKTDEPGCGAAREYYFSSLSRCRHVADRKIRT